MKLRPTSLGARLAWSAAVLVIIALVVAGTGIRFALGRFVQGEIDQRLDAQIATIGTAMERDGGAYPRDVEPYDRPESGWYWVVRGEDGSTVARSISLGSGDIQVFPARFRWEEFWNFRPQPAEGRGPHGESLHLRVSQRIAGGRPVTIIASAPREAIARPMADAMKPLVGALTVLGVLLTAASYTQVRFGLRPLRRLQASVADVRAGRLRHVPADQPAELAPLTAELNSLLDQNVAGLERARRNVANLAHALKTPLATMAVALDRSQRPEDVAMARELQRMERQIRHHLGRARAAALDGQTRARTPLRARIDEFATMFAKVYADKAVAFSTSIPADLMIACEQQDLDEMLGNVLDNAFKWARSRIVVDATSGAAGRIDLVVEDDGPGLSAHDMPDALKPGKKLDEAVAGDGFGLSITKELAELYNGGLSLKRSALGGLAATIALPTAM